MWIVVVDTTPEGRVAKYMDFEEKTAADAHVKKVEESYPTAFVSEAPEGGFADWRVENGELVYDPPAPGPVGIAARRYEAETAGTTWNGWPVATDRQSQAVVGNAHQLAKDGHWQDGAVWKFADGKHRSLDAADVIALALTVAAHVQGCFEVEAQKLAAHEAGDPVDLETGWPA